MKYKIYINRCFYLLLVLSLLIFVCCKKNKNVTLKYFIDENEILHWDTLNDSATSAAQSAIPVKKLAIPPSDNSVKNLLASSNLPNKIQLK